MGGEVADSQPNFFNRNNFNGGVNTDQFATVIGENQVQSLANCYHKTVGQITTIGGFEQIGDTAVSSKVKGLVNYVDTSSIEYLGGIDSQATPHLWTIKSGDTTFTDEGALTGFTGGNDVYGTQLLDRLFMVDGNGSMVSWDGTNIRQATNTNADPPQGAKGLFTFMGRLFVWKGAEIYYSRTGFPFTSEPSTSSFTGGWDRTNQALFVGLGNGQEIVHCEPYRTDRIVVFMTRSIYVIQIASQNVFNLTYFGNPAPPSFIIQPLSTIIGCSARGSVVQIGSDMFFRDQNGQVRSVKQTAEDEMSGVLRDPISQPIRTTLEDSSQLFLSKSAAWLWKNQYHVSYAGSTETENSQTSTFDGILQSWAGVHTFYASRAISSSWEGFDSIYFYRDEDLDEFKIYRFDSGDSFNNEEIPVVIQTRRENHGLPFSKKKGLWAEFYFVQGEDASAQISFSVDGQGYQALPNGVVDLSGNAGTLPQAEDFYLGSDGVLAYAARLTDVGLYLDISFQIETSEVDKPMTFLGYSVFALPQAPRRSTTFA